MRISGLASADSIASTSNGRMKSIIAPVTRTVVASASCSTTVVSQSCASSFARMSMSAARTPAPTSAQS